MMSEFDRRSALKAMAAAAAVGLAAKGGTPALAAAGLLLGDPQLFSFDALRKIAHDMASRPYVGPDLPAPEIVEKIDYEAWGNIRFDSDYAVYANGPGDFPVTFFHLGKFFRKSVEMHVVEGDRERQIIYDPRYFQMPADSVARQLPQGVGFAGFRVQETRDGSLDWRRNDWVAFLGASYFRAIGELYQYGLSARGIALDTAVADRREEFPDFTKFYIGAEAGDTVSVFALLDGPSIVGAYRFQMSRTLSVLMDIECSLFLRRDIARFGIAPLTSMYWFSETMKPTAIDWRPEVHDSDGLAMWTGAGTRLWRPLNNPPRTMASSFKDETPKGFGLLQRDRAFDHYVDGVFYDRRPSLWVEPIGDWGRGAVQLIEIPTDDEIHDNIVAMWVPEAPVQAGAQFDLHYKLHWVAKIFLRAGMQRNGHAVQRLRQIDVLGSLMGRGQFIGRFEDALGHLIDEIIRQTGAGDEIVDDRRILHRRGLAAVGVGRNGRLDVGRADLVHERSRDLDDRNVDGAGEIADRRHAEASRLQCRVELPVLHQIDGFGEGQIFDLAQVLVGQAGSRKNRAGIQFCARLGRADGQTLSFQVGKRLDAALLRGDDLNVVRIDRRDAAQVIELRLEARLLIALPSKGQAVAEREGNLSLALL